MKTILITFLILTSNYVFGQSELFISQWNQVEKIIHDIDSTSINIKKSKQFFGSGKVKMKLYSSDWSKAKTTKN